MVIPQAALSAAFKGPRNIKYHRQMDKALAERVYQLFCAALHEQLVFAEFPERKAAVENQRQLARAQAKREVKLEDTFKTGDWEGQFSQ